MKGWGKIKAIAAYGGVSDRTVETWIKKGLKCTRMPTGLRLIKLEWVDQYLEKFADSEHQVDRIVDEVIKDFGKTKKSS